MNPTEAKALSAMFLAALEREYQTTRNVLSAVPETQLDFKLGEKGRTSRELMWHIVTAEFWFADGVIKGSFPQEGELPAPASGKEILSWYEQNVPPLLEKVKQLSGEQLAQTVSFFNVFNLPAVMYLSFSNAHSIHHRGYLAAYLRAMNARVPSIYGGSADEPFEMPATA